MNRLLLTLSFLLLFCQMAFAAPLDMAVTVAGAGDNSGVSGGVLDWQNAMALADWEADILAGGAGGIEAGDVYYMAAGTYTLTQNIVIVTSIGTFALPTKFIGVKTGTTNEPPVFSDWAYGDARPLIAAADFTFMGTSIDSHHTLNIRFTTVDVTGISSDNYNLFWNVKVYQSSGSAYEALQVGAEGRVINCDLQSDNGQALFSSFAAGGQIMGNYFHDSAKGFEPDNGDQQNIIGNIFDTCTIGIEAIDADSNFVVNNTFYNCTTGYHTNDVTGHGAYVSNIFDECTTPADWANALDSEWFDYNSWDGDAASNVNVTVGGNSIDVDITLTDPGAGDFTLQAASAPLGIGLRMTDNEGLKAGVDTKWNIGQDQDDNTVAGGGGGSTGFMFID